MNILLNPHNHLFELARSGKRLPHIVLVIGLGYVFMLLAQLIGGIPATLLILALSIAEASQPTLGDPDVLRGLLLPNNALEQFILLVLAFGPIFLILWGWLTLFEKRPLWTIGLERIKAAQKYLRGLLIGLLMFSASVGLLAIFGYIDLEAGDPQQQGLTALGGVLLVFLGWMVQGAAEEAITRGWILPVIGARYKPLLGIVISAIIFATYHSLNPNLNPIAILNLFLSGLFFALFALYEGGLWGVFAIHTAWNWTQGNLFGFEVSGLTSTSGTLFNLMEVGPDAITGGTFGPEGGLAVTVVLVISCLLVWVASRRRSRATPPGPEPESPDFLSRSSNTEPANTKADTPPNTLES
jgi:membrane protease YdiL (CAAX protease family)